MKRFCLLFALVLAAGMAPANIPRLNEQLGFGFDKAGNLWLRTNGGLGQTFNCDSLNQLTNITRNSVMTVSGATPAPAAYVTVNGQAAQTYGDFTFAATNLTLSDGNNTFTIAAQSLTGSNATSSLTMSLPQSVALKWDSNGNLTNDGTRSFAYSPENQLTNITVGGAWKTDFIFDGLGRRRVELDYSWQGGNWTKTNELHFVYDGWLLVQVRDGNNNVLVTYTRGVGLSGSLSSAGGIGGLLARTDGNGSTFYHADGSGNITGLMDGQQNMASRNVFGPFGNVLLQGGPMAGVDPMGFSSMPQAHGIVFYPGRPYLLGPQRWASPDPFGALFDTNPYRVNYNNPLRYIDPDGLAPQLTSVSFNASSGAQTGAGYTDYNLANGPYRGGPGNPLSMLDAISPDTQTSAQDLANSLGLGNNREVVDALKNAIDLLLVAGLPEMEGAGGLGQVGKLEKALAQTEKAATKVKCPTKGGTYLLRNPSTGEVVRTGRTGDLMRREAEHLNDPMLSRYTFETVHATDNYAEQRGLEQLLHDTYGPPLNRISPIDPANPNRQLYLDAAQQFLQGGGK